MPTELYREKQNVLQEQELSIWQKLTCEENNEAILKRMEEIKRFLQKEDVWGGSCCDLSGEKNGTDQSLSAVYGDRIAPFFLQERNKI